MRGVFYLIVSLLAGSATAQAAMIDCTRVTLPITRLICANPTLASLDDALADAYSAAADATLDRPSLEAAEQDWYGREILSNNWFATRGIPIDGEKLVQAYQHHIDDLKQQTAAWLAVRAPVASDQLAKSCLALPPEPREPPCRVTAFAPVEGDPSLRYQFQSFSDDDPAAALVVFQARDGDSAHLVPLLAGSARRDGQPPRYKLPGATNAPDGRFLIIAASFTTGDPPGELLLYRYGDGIARIIDTDSWLKDLQQHLPAGLMASDIAIDYVKMTASVTLMQRTGASGGHAAVTLKIDQDRLTIRDVKLHAAPN